MRYIFSLICVCGIFHLSQSQTILIECDEALGENKSILRVVSVPDGEVNTKEFELADEAKFAYIEAIEKLNIAQFKVSEFDIMKFERDGDTYLRYATFLTVDVAGGQGGQGGPMGMPQGDPGMPQEQH